MTICAWSFQLGWFISPDEEVKRLVIHSVREWRLCLALNLSIVHWAVGGLYSFDCTSSPQPSSPFYFKKGAAVSCSFKKDWQLWQTFSLLYQLELWGQSVLHIRVVVVFQRCALLCAHSTCRDESLRHSVIFSTLQRVSAGLRERTVSALENKSGLCSMNLLNSNVTVS